MGSGDLQPVEDQIFIGGWVHTPETSAGMDRLTLAMERRGISGGATMQGDGTLQITACRDGKTISFQKTEVGAAIAHWNAPVFELLASHAEAYLGRA